MGSFQLLRVLAEALKVEAFLVFVLAAMPAQCLRGLNHTVLWR